MEFQKNTFFYIFSVILFKITIRKVFIEHKSLFYTRIMRNNSKKIENNKNLFQSEYFLWIFYVCMGFLVLIPKCNLPSYPRCTALGNVGQSSSHLGENVRPAPLNRHQYYLSICPGEHVRVEFMGHSAAHQFKTLKHIFNQLFIIVDSVVSRKPLTTFRLFQSCFSCIKEFCEIIAAHYLFYLWSNENTSFNLSFR